MAWLVRDGDVLAALAVSASRSDRLWGLWGRPKPEGALLLRRPPVLHTVGLPYAVDVAFCDRDLLVRSTLRLARYRVALPRLGAKMIVVAGEGAFERWRLAAGDRLEVKGG